MQDETVALSGETSIDIKAGLELGAIKAKATGGYSSDFADKHGMTLSNENVKIAKIGDPNPVAIFFDLRPASELMNPIFLEYNPLDDWKSLAPFVWCDLRNSFDAYLASLGAGENIPAVFLESYTPRTIKVSVPKLWLSMLPPEGEGLNQGHYEYQLREGSISIEAIGGAIEYGKEQRKTISLEYEDVMPFDATGNCALDLFYNLVARESQRSAGFRVSGDLVISQYGYYHSEEGRVGVDNRLPIKINLQKAFSEIPGKVIHVFGSSEEVNNPVKFGIEVNVEVKEAQS
jgi:hypothetical protein